MSLKVFTRFVVLIFLFYSCAPSPEPGKIKDVNEMKIVDHLVSLQQATKIAELSTFMLHQSSKQMSALRKTGGDTTLFERKRISKTLAVNNSQEAASFYIFNFEGGGFAIVAGDDRLYPIIAYSDKSFFPLDSNQYYPSGLVGWLADTDELVRTIRKENLGQSKETELLWKNIDYQVRVASGKVAAFVLPECYSDGQIYNYTESWGPYLTTTWSQGEGYNNSLPAMGCTSYTNGRPPVGCVATATAQIMKFHQYPNSFSWSSMPPDQGSTATANLMADIGNKVGMDYDCDGSGADVDDAADALRNNYGYTSATWNSTYSSATVFNDLRLGRPSILRGGRQSKWWIFNVYDDGHAWVCDGGNLIEEYKCNYGEDDGDSYSTDYTWAFNGSNMLLHMNWGWGGQHDGYYLYNNFNPSTHTFNYKPGMITNIVP